MSGNNRRGHPTDGTCTIIVKDSLTKLNFNRTLSNTINKDESVKASF